MNSNKEALVSDPYNFQTPVCLEEVSGECAGALEWGADPYAASFGDNESVWLCQGHYTLATQYQHP